LSDDDLYSDTGAVLKECISIIMVSTRIKFLILLLPIFLFSTTYYVSPDGNDNNSGLSPDSAFATLQHAADIVAAGDSVLVLNGEYVGFDLRTSGSIDSPIVFKTLGDSVIINQENSTTPDGVNIENADWIVIDGFRVEGIPRAGIRVAVSQHVTIRNNYCSYNGRWGIFTAFADYAVIENNECSYSTDEHGIYFSNSADHPIIRKNICHHNRANGIHMNGDESMGGDGLITDARVEANIIYENGTGGGSGINCDGVAESVIFNNLLYMNHSSGISLYRIDASAGSYHDKIFNNTIVNADDARWCININTGSTGDTLYNNILINLHSWRGSISIDSSSTAGFFSDYNIVIDRLSNDGGNSIISLSQWQSLGYDLHSQLAASLDSIFVNWQNSDYHLCTGSQAIDTGTDLVAGIVLYDLDSIPRPQGSGFDIGAYEYQPVFVQEDDFRASRPSTVIRTGEFITFSNLYPGDRVSIFDVSGRRCSTSGRLNTGKWCWSTCGVPSGIYFYQITSDVSDEEERGKLVILK